MFLNAVAVKIRCIREFTANTKLTSDLEKAESDS